VENDYLSGIALQPSLSIRESRFRAVCRVAARLMGEGRHVFSPIAHTHPIAMAGTLPTGWEYWREYDRAMLSACSSVIVLRLPGWQESAGIAGELAIARELGLPVEYIDPESEDLR
jgi:hypothetical protein